MNTAVDAKSVLDAEELLYLALQAMEQDRDEDAISCLKRALLLDPDSGILHHLLGAMYAQLGMIDRAIDEMTQAVELAPGLHMARFQLGLLHFTSTDLGAAQKVWEPLAELPPDSALGLFRSGLLHLARNEFAECALDLKRGMELNTEHPSLNHDMEMLIKAADEALDEATAIIQAAPPPADAGRHVLLSGYQGLADEKKK